MQIIYCLDGSLAAEEWDLNKYPLRHKVDLGDFIVWLNHCVVCLVKGDLVDDSMDALEIVEDWVIEAKLPYSNLYATKVTENNQALFEVKQ